MVFENNPYLTELVDKLMAEKKILEQDLDRTKLDVKDREAEIARLRALVDKLRNGIENFKPDFGGNALPDQRNMKAYLMGRRADMLEQSLIFKDKLNAKLVKQLCLRILELNRNFNKMLKRYERENRDKLGAIRSAGVQDPLYIWAQLRIRMIKFLFEVFIRSKDESMKNKT